MSTDLKNLISNVVKAIDTASIAQNQAVKAQEQANVKPGQSTTPANGGTAGTGTQPANPQAT